MDLVKIFDLVAVTPAIAVDTAVTAAAIDIHVVVGAKPLAIFCGKDHLLGRYIRNIQ